MENKEKLTKEEAVREIESYIPKDEPMNAKDRAAFFMAIEALKAMPSKRYVSIDEILALAKEECETAVIPYNRFVKRVNALQPVLPKSNEVHYEYTDYTTNQAMDIMLTAERDVCECMKKHNNNDTTNIAEVAFNIGIIMSRARSDIYALLKAEENKSYKAKEAKENA